MWASCTFRPSSSVDDDSDSSDDDLLIFEPSSDVSKFSGPNRSSAFGCTAIGASFGASAFGASFGASFGAAFGAAFGASGLGSATVSGSGFGSNGARITASEHFPPPQTLHQERQTLLLLLSP